MRETYVPLFQDIRASSLWAHDSDIRMVWITLLTMVDPEGYVCAAIPGIAVAANVPVAKVRQAIEIFEAPDPDSRSTEHEGRRIQKVPRGWLLLNYTAIRKRAQVEAERARKRRWAQNQRAANDSAPSLAELDAEWTADASETLRSEPVDASKSKSESVSFSSEPVVVTSLSGWEPTDALRQEALAAGVRDFDARLEELRRGPIGGKRGVFASKLDDYVRAQFGKWKTWGETDSFKAHRSNPGAAPPEAPKPPRVAGCPRWVYPAHAEFAAAHRLDLKPAAKDFARSYYQDVRGMRPCDLHAPFMAHLQKLAAEGEARRSA